MLDLPWGCSGLTMSSSYCFPDTRAAATGSPTPASSPSSSEAVSLRTEAAGSGESRSVTKASRMRPIVRKMSSYFEFRYIHAFPDMGKWAFLFSHARKERRENGWIHSDFPSFGGIEREMRLDFKSRRRLHSPQFPSFFPKSENHHSPFPNLDDDYILSLLFAPLTYPRLSSSLQILRPRRKRKEDKKKDPAQCWFHHCLRFPRQ